MAVAAIVATIAAQEASAIVTYALAEKSAATR